MFRFIYKTLHHGPSAVGHSQSHSLYYVRIHPYSKCVQSIYTSPDPLSFAASYLINSCGFPPDKAIFASRYVKFKASDNPDSVLAFFDSHGFSKNQISRLVRNCPQVLLCNPEKTLLPKIEFFKSQGISSADVAKMLSKHPSAFRRSMWNNIIPSFEFFNNFLQSKEKTIAAIKRNGRILLLNHKTCTIPNIEVLQEVGLPQKHIASLLSLHPAVFLCSSTKLKEVVESVKKMGFNPMKGTFAIAVYVMRSMRKSTWEKKLEVF
ncbi:hypothetical protein NMG60_11017394 [Bertholletia excelsa]